MDLTTIVMNSLISIPFKITSSILIGAIQRKFSNNCRTNILLLQVHVINKYKIANNRLFAELQYFNFIRII